MELSQWHDWWKKRGRYGLNRILWEDWDPIGAGVPLDEYSGYAGTVAKLLREEATQGEIARFLGKARVENIGLDPDPVGDGEAAAKCIAYFQDEMRALVLAEKDAASDEKRNLPSPPS